MKDGPPSFFADEASLLQDELPEALSREERYAADNEVGRAWSAPVGRIILASAALRA